MRTGQILDQYKAGLASAQIAAGMNAAKANARRLHEDAALLLEKGRYPSALSLAILSIEESGKLPILRSLALARDQKELSATWREYRSHTRKNVMWLFAQLLLQGARRFADFGPLFESGAEHPFILDSIKQLGFYTDCLGNKHWSLPDEVIDEELARGIVGIAQHLLPKREVTEREIELWIQHLQPVSKRDAEMKEAAVAAWYRQMCAEGLICGDPEKMERFIVQGIGSDSKNAESSNS